MKNATKSLLAGLFGCLPLAALAWPTPPDWSGQPTTGEPGDADPVVTTPGSLMPTLPIGDYLVAINDPEPAPPSETGAADAGQTTASQGSVGIGCSWYSGDRFDTNVCTVPLTYTVRNELDPRRRLTLKLPITRMESGGRTAYNYAFGASYTFPVGTRWYLTPGASYGIANQGDFATEANVGTVSLTSAYFMKREGFDIGIGNMLGYSKTFDEQGMGDAHTTLLRNGVLLSWPSQVFGKKHFLEASLVDTLFFGSDTYTKNQWELGFTVGDKRSYKVTAGGYRFGLTLIKGNDLSGINLTAGYWF